MAKTRRHEQGGKGGKKKSKLVLTFDADKRKDYLTGFHKRKQERRRFGLDMEAFKQKKKLLAARKQRREEQKALLSRLHLNEDENEQEKDKVQSEEEDDVSDADSEQAPSNTTNVMRFDDEHTQARFGDIVTVTTQVGDLPEDSDDSLSDLDDLDETNNDEVAIPAKYKSGKVKDKDKQLTLFQRIQLKRRGLALPSKRSKIKQSRESRKAMGVGSKKKGKKGMAQSAGRKGGDGDASEGKASGKKSFGSNNKRRKH